MAIKKIKKIKDSLKYLQPHDFIDPFIFIIAFLCAIPFRIYNRATKRNIWLICEDGQHARDNGYYFFEYVRKHHPKDPCYYAISKHSEGYQKVNQLGNVIKFRSLKHWIFYLSAQYNISSQKNGSPSVILFYIFHVIFGLYQNRVFLQHGITKDDSKWLYFSETKFRFFICGAKPEYEYIKNKFGYPANRVLLTGFPRFDSLYDFKVNPKQILVMPTWRNWLGRDTNALSRKNNFKKTKYFEQWNSLLTNQELINFIEKHDIELLFYPHSNMQKYLADFDITSKNIKALDFNTDIQSILKTSALMITDYSSVFMDFAYMGKPVIYFQFDKDEYRQKQYQEGYFSYERDGFGEVSVDAASVVTGLKHYYNNGYKVSPVHSERAQSFFDPKDRNNCSRIYAILTVPEFNHAK